MFKKIICIFLCLIFLLSISCVVADENISDYPSLPDDIGVMEECSEIDGAEIDGESFDDSYDEYDISKVDQSVELNTTGIVMSDDEYSCGAASFATVANNLGINISLDEAKTAVNTTINGTTMEGILNGASKYKLYATGIYINSTELKENYIVHMYINNTYHWSVVKEVTENNIILADSNVGYINYIISEFNQYFTQKAIVISSSSLENFNKNNILIDKSDSKLISGKLRVISKTKKTTKLYTEFRWHKHKLQYRWVYLVATYYAYKEYKSWKYYLHDWTFKKGSWKNC